MLIVEMGLVVFSLVVVEREYGGVDVLVEIEVVGVSLVDSVGGVVVSPQTLEQHSTLIL